MRRKDRAVSSTETIKQIVADNHVLRLGLFNGSYPYIVPVNYGYEWQEDQLVFYLHGALKGQKIDCIQANPHVCVELDGNHALISGGRTVSKCSYAYQSLIGFGIAELLSDPKEKKYALDLLMAHLRPGESYDEIPLAMVKHTSVIKITIEEYTAKEHPLPEA